MEDSEKVKETKPLPWRLILFLVVGILLVTGIWYSYYWFSSTSAKLQEAERVANQAQQYEILSEKIQTEYQRCQQFIAQEQGGFGEFEYCQRFIEWVNEATNSPEDTQ